MMAFPNERRHFRMSASDATVLTRVGDDAPAATTKLLPSPLIDADGSPVPCSCRIAAVCVQKGGQTACSSYGFTGIWRRRRRPPNSTSLHQEGASNTTVTDVTNVTNSPHFWSILVGGVGVTDVDTHIWDDSGEH